MLTAHHSNRLDTLADELAAVMAAPLGSALAAEVVVVQSRGVARWLSLRLAERTGVCANIRFPFPAAFAWELFRSMCGNIPEQSSFDPEILTWRILGLLPELESLPLFAPVRRYVAGGDLRRFELSERLARLFDEYLVYRPDWIVRWERGPAEQWQAELWRRLVGAAPMAHAANLHARVLETLAGPSVPANLPQRVSVFGAPALPPSLLELLTALGAHSDVHLFVQNPCREYWGDIAPHGEIARRRLDSKADAAYLESGNGLLASLGKQGRDFIDLLTGAAGEALRERDRFADPGHDSLLASIQSDILDLEERTPALAASSAFGSDELSVQIHSCHSAMREVEVLHDQLLALFSRSPDLQPSDVVVMTPDIEVYAPYIEAVFATAEPRIPFNISDRASERESTLAATFMALLELVGSRYEANRVLAILDEEAVRRRFGLTESDVETVRTWVRDAQIRWGIDAAHRASFGLPATHEHTWRFGLERLLLGYALPAQKERLFGAVLAYDEIEGSLGEVLGRFTSFVEAALALDTQFAGARPIARWCGLLQGLLAIFFDPTEQRAEELEAVRAAVGAIEKQARAARFGGAVPLAVVVSALRARLEVPGRAFLSGGVTFCAMVPMRSLPFEIVCMIGMNDRAYPRMRRRDSFDLMADDFRKGDRARRDDDRYLFLESILNARRCLYMSYTGRHIREDTVIPPSVLVNDLLDYVARDDGNLRERLVTEHPLQAFSRRYFSGDPKLFSYSATRARAASVAGGGTRVPQPFLTTPLPAAEPESRSVDLDSFIRFFRNPARHLFEQRLKVRLETPQEEIETREPFELGGLAGFDLKQRLLDLRLRGIEHDGVALARAGGELPHGRLGEALYEAAAEIVQRVARTVAPLAGERDVAPLRFELKAGEVTLSGTLMNVGPGGMLDYRMSKTNEHLRIRAWIRHLVLNALAPAGVARTSRCVTQECVLTFSPVENPLQKLSALADLYWRGLHGPIHFFPRTAWMYVNTDSDDIISRVRSVWQGSSYDEDAPRGECEDPYYKLAFRGIDPLDAEFTALARAIFGPMRAAMTEKPLP
ncbi:MAG TPA: exodeoxyribonuclease V subunit gamma [Burkholderiales bacterium]|nr:exodeoxyribonuclease V subunit gamma [Burkholderiales bacterium]